MSAIQSVSDHGSSGGGGLRSPKRGSGSVGHARAERFGSMALMVASPFSRYARLPPGTRIASRGRVGIRLGEQVVRETLEVQGDPTVVSAELDRQIAEIPGDAVDD
jgi:hypothetical protein